jgi:integrase
MAPLSSLAIETAMRQGELLSLTWADVDLQRRIAHLKDTKNSEPRDVPLSTRALQLIRALPRPIDGVGPLFPISQDEVIRTFRKACTDAKIENLKFHDLRHEATSRICDRLPMHEAMRVTGHKTPAMLMRYYHPKAEDLAKKLA